LLNKLVSALQRLIELSATGAMSGPARGRTSIARLQTNVLDEAVAPSQVIRVLRRISHRHSDGIVISALADPMISTTLALIADGGTPIVSLSRPHRADKRIMYIGFGSRAAGATAAYLMSGFLNQALGSVLMCGTADDRAADDDRALGFRVAMNEAATPAVRVITPFNLPEPG
jgi:LacI family transcriptional regulator